MGLRKCRNDEMDYVTLRIKDAFYKRGKGWFYHGEFIGKNVNEALTKLRLPIYNK